MNRPDSLKQRVEFLEREIASLKELRREQIPGVYDTAPSPRLARTINDGGYPTAPSKVYPICFLDGVFDSSSTGNITPTFTQHSQNCQANAYAVSDGTYLPPGTLGHAWRQNGRYWFVPVVESSDAMAIVRVDASEGIPLCGDTSPNAQCVWDGKLVGMGIGGTDLCGEIWTDIGACWIKPVNACSAPSALKKGERFIARKVGQFAIGSDTRDLYQIQAGAPSAASLQEATFWKASPRVYDATGASRDRFLTAGAGTDSMGFIFEETWNSSLNIVHEEANTDFAGNGNFLVNEDGYYQITTSLVTRLARDSSGASAPPASPVNCGFSVNLEASGISSDAGLASVAVVAHNEADGWGTTGSIFTWQPQMTHTHITQTNLYAGTRFKVGAFIPSSAFGQYPSGYGQYIQGIRLHIRRLSGTVAFVTS